MHPTVGSELFVVGEYLLFVRVCAHMYLGCCFLGNIHLAALLFEKGLPIGLEITN